MKTLFLIHSPDSWLVTYENLRRRFAAERLVLRDPPPSDRKWKNILRMATTQARHSIPLFWFIVRSRESVLLVSAAAHYAALSAGLAARILGKKPKVYLCNFYLHSLGRHPLIEWLLSGLLAQDVGILVQSPEEVVHFRRRNPRILLEWHPYCQGFVSDALGDCPSEGYVFAGGATNRDYDTLIKVAQRVPSARFVIVRSRANRITATIPPNVEILTDVPRARFQALLGHSMLVVLPLKDDVGSSGQMVALLAMQMGKPVVYADYPVVGQYFKDGDSGIACRPRDVADLEARVLLAIEDEVLRRRLGRQARVEWEARFTRDRYEQALIESIERFAARGS